MTGQNLFRLNRACIRIAGAGARDFLHGLVTQDLGLLGPETPVYAGLLTPQGKVIADFFVHARGDDDFLLEADVTRVADLQQRLVLYRLRAPIDIVAVDDVAILWCADARFPAAAPDPRMPDGALGYRSLRAGSAAAALASGDDALRAQAIVCGVPDLARDSAPEEVFALEALFEELHGVAFNKGCFVGQENVSRMKRRATTRKKFCRLAIIGDTPSVGAPIRDGDVEVGSVRAVEGAHALGLVRLDRALGAGAAGRALLAGAAVLRLDPPKWLSFPPTET